MALTLNQGRDLAGIADEMNRLVNSVFGDSAREASFYKGTWIPAVDISEDDDNYHLYIELPGISKDSVNIRYEDGMLTLSGEKLEPKASEKVNFHRVERTYGKFERSFRVPSLIVSDKIDATFQDGLLTVMLPKAEESKPKQIEVKIK
jgi:HSP20 family protein